MLKNSLAHVAGEKQRIGSGLREGSEKAQFRRREILSPSMILTR